MRSSAYPAAVRFSQIHAAAAGVLLATLLASMSGCARQTLTPAQIARIQAREESLYQCPAWAREELPGWVMPYVGRFGLPDPYPRQKELIGDVTAGIDLWQANHFITYRPETAEFLYQHYSPTQVNYTPGTLPAYEAVVAQYTAGLTTPREKALALLTRAMLEKVKHPGIPPMTLDPGKDRGIDDLSLLASGRGWCNEQARVFIRLCQVAGIPARMVFLFLAPTGGHVVTEFYADGRWSMADSSWFCVFPGPDGQLMSAAECHGTGKPYAGQAYFKRYQEIIAYSDEIMVGDKFPDQSDPQARQTRVAQSAEATRNEYRAHTAKTLGNQLWAFGILNYPLPM